MPHNPPFSLLPTMPPSTATTTAKPRKTTATTTTLHHNNHNHHTSSLFCRHHHPSATATLDLLILILVLISCTFLITSYFSYLLHSLSLLLPLHLHLHPAAFLSAAAVAVVGVSLFVLLLRPRRRRCGNPQCKGLTKALEFDLQLQSEETLRKAAVNVNVNLGDLEKLPWKGGSEGNPDYECLRAELRKMAPPNGRAVLLFRSKCGCPVAKLVGWAPKKPRKHKKVLASTANNGDHR
ncbi:hypothetical protein vseg_012119 [Gypsophila vaccaria]